MSFIAKCLLTPEHWAVHFGERSEQQKKVDTFASPRSPLSPTHPLQVCGDRGLELTSLFGCGGIVHSVAGPKDGALAPQRSTELDCMAQAQTNRPASRHGKPVGGGVRGGGLEKGLELSPAPAAAA